MSEAKQNSNTFPEIASPHTSFALVKSVKALGQELLTNADEDTVRDFNEHNEKAFFVGSNRPYFGQLEDWDGRFFSFAKLGISPEDQHPDAALPHCDIQIDFQPEVLKTSRPIPDGTISTLSFDTESKYVDEGGIFQRTVAFRQEGSPMVEDWVVDTATPNKDHTWLRIDQWRELSETEAQNLLFDVVDLKSRLDDYLATNPEPLWSEDSTI